MSAARKSLWTILVIVILFVYTSFYTVSEGQSALLLRLGKIVLGPNGEVQGITPGLHFKIPFIYQTRKLDIRLQSVTAQSSRILTLDQKYVIVDYYIKWRIQDLSLYYQRTGGDAIVAQNLLQQQVNDALRAAFGERTLTDMVSGERVNVMSLLKNSANATAKNLGISVADVRIKSIDLPKEVSEAVFNNMRTEREKDAAQYRAGGRAEAEAIIANAQAKAAVSVAQAEMQAAEVRAKGAASAANIYSDAYQQDADFYSFYRSLEAYLVAFNNKSDVMVLTPESEFFKYFNSAQLPPVNSEVRAAAVKAAAASAAKNTLLLPPATKVKVPASALPPVKANDQEPLSVQQLTPTGTISTEKPVAAPAASSVEPVLPSAPATSSPAIDHSRADEVLGRPTR